MIKSARFLMAGLTTGPHTQSIHWLQLSEAGAILPPMTYRVQFLTLK